MIKIALQNTLLFSTSLKGTKKSNVHIIAHSISKMQEEKCNLCGKVRESLRPREGIPKASIGIALVGSQQAAVYFLCFWP